MVNNDDLAVTALIISLVALLTTTLQVLQQYFATADGYRRCQSSVIGGWARFTRRRFRWSEFRFETIFVVPEITFLTLEAIEVRPGTRPVDGDTSPGSEKEHVTPQQPVQEEEIESGIRSTPEVIYRSQNRDKAINPDWVDFHMGRKVLFEGPASWTEDEYRKFTQAFDSRKGGRRNKLDGIGWTYYSRERKPVVGKSVRKPSRQSLWDEELSLDRKLTGSNKSGEKACWLDLMYKLSDLQWRLRRASKRDFLSAEIVPAFQGRQRSWDFMPQDVIRPFVTVSICDLVIIARLLGMRWSLFDPQNGLLRAEGHTCLMDSRVVPSIGTMIDFKSIRNVPTSQELSVMDTWYIPKAQSYMMMFGIIPADPELTTFAPDGFPVSVDQERRGVWRNTLYKISKACRANTTFDDVGYHAADMLPLVAPMLRDPQSPIIKTPKVYSRTWDSWLGLRRTFNAFPVELQKYHDTQQQHDVLAFDASDLGPGKKDPSIISQILEGEKELRRLHLKYWNAPWPDNLHGQEQQIITFCDAVLSQFQLAQNFLVDLITHHEIPHFYEELVLSHLVLLTRSDYVKPTKEREEKKGLLGQLRRSNKPQEQMRYMFEHLDDLGRELGRRYPGLREAEVKDAWIVMVWRGMCWRRCHGPEGEDYEPVQSQYWRSKQQVNIG